LVADALAETDGLGLAEALVVAVAEVDVLGNAVLGRVVAQKAAVLLDTNEPATERIRKQYWMAPPRPVI
jgi:hypothetical protein